MTDKIIQQQIEYYRARALPIMMNGSIALVVTGAVRKITSAGSTKLILSNRLYKKLDKSGKS
jgi:hypothetical protein